MGLTQLHAQERNEAGSPTLWQPTARCRQALGNVVQLKDALCSVLGGESISTSPPQKPSSDDVDQLREACVMMSRALSSLQKELDSSASSRSEGVTASEVSATSTQSSEVK